MKNFPSVSIEIKIIVPHNFSSFQQTLHLLIKYSDKNMTGLGSPVPVSITKVKWLTGGSFKLL